MPHDVEAGSPWESGDDGMPHDVEDGSPWESGDDGVPQGPEADSPGESDQDGVHQVVEADSPRESDDDRYIWTIFQIFCKLQVGGKIIENLQGPGANTRMYRLFQT